MSRRDADNESVSSSSTAYHDKDETEQNTPLMSEEVSQKPKVTHTFREIRSDNAGPSSAPPQPEKPVTWMSLPHKDQLLILAICRLSEPLSNTTLLPYLYYLMKSLQSSGDTSGWISRQAGLVVALFSFAQFATSMLWARAADKYGRKRVIMIGVCISIISNLGFGFSRSVFSLCFWRVVAGIGNGNIGVMRTMTAEIVKERKYQSRAFLLLPLIFNSGVVIGLALGGILAQPVDHLSWLFGPHGLFNVFGNPEGVAWMRAYPFALPTIFNASLLLFSFTLGFLWLRETLAGKEGEPDIGTAIGERILRLIKGKIYSSGKYAALASDEAEIGLIDRSRGPGGPGGPPSGSKEKGHGGPGGPPTQIYTSEVRRMLVSFSLLPLHNSSFMQLFPLFLSMPRSQKGDPDVKPSLLRFVGGLALPSSTVGLYLSAFGVFGIFLQLLIYPRMQARIGTLWSYRVALFIFPFAYLLAPYLSWTPEAGLLKWFGVCFILFSQVMARTFAIPSSVILLTRSSPSPKALGRIHGFGNMMSSLSRAVGPLFTGFLFAWGCDHMMVGFVWWAFLMLVSAAALAQSWMLVEKGEEGPRR